MTKLPLTIGCVVLAALAFLPMPGALAAPPTRVTLAYDTSYNGMVVGEVVEVLEHDSHTYTITSEVTKGVLSLVGAFKRTSHGKITPQGLQPDEYRDQRGSKWAVTAKFDWTALTVTQERDGKSETLKIPPSACDPLSLAYSFAFVLPTGKEFEVTRADGRGLTPFRFTVVGVEKLATPAGEMQALHVAKVRDGPEDRSTDIWFASEKGYLPVRVLVVDKNGTRADQILSRIGN
jgi:Protein of unknown function (DUF3108)